MPRPRVRRPTRPWRSVLLRLLACLLGGAIAAFPVAVIFGLTETEVKDDFGIVPATLSLKPGYSSLDTGLLGTIYDSDFTQYGVGMNIKLDGLPANLSKIHSVDSPELKRVRRAYAGMFQNPDDIRAGYSNAMADAVTGTVLRTELEAGLVLALVAFVISSLHGAASTRRTLAATIGVLFIISSGYSVHRYLEWKSANELPEPTYPVEVLADTPLKNAVVDSRTTAALIDGVVPLAQAQLEREELANREFLANADQTIDEAVSAGRIASPGEGETAVLLLSDVHSNADMIKVYRRLVADVNDSYGDGTLQIALFDGDQAYGGAADKSAVDNMAKIAAHSYAVVGNHDSHLTIQQMRDAGMTVLSGPAVDIGNGLSAVGVIDPNLTKQGALFVADNVQRPGTGDMTEQEAGEILKQRVDSSDPTIAMAHEPEALEPLLQIPDMTKDGMTNWFAGDQRLADPDAGDQPDDGVPDINASAVAFGHWHREFHYRVVGNSDGTWTVVMELGTAGGVSPVQSLSHFSTPQTIPGKRASAAIMVVNNDSGLVTAVQELSTDRDGAFRAGETHHVGSFDGQPYPVAEQANTRAPSPSE